ncbi:MAG: hypothetical protein WDN06_16930 [Asticcacaulis sp.]
MRTFVAEAAFYGKSSALAAAMIAELRRFSGGAEVALYLAGKKGAYVLDDGGVAGIAASVDGDDKTFVALRAGNTAQNMPDGGLALPLMPRRDPGRHCLRRRQAFGGSLAAGRAPGSGLGGASVQPRPPRPQDGASGSPGGKKPAARIRPGGAVETGDESGPADLISVATVRTILYRASI